MPLVLVLDPLLPLLLLLVLPLLAVLFDPFWKVCPRSREKVWLRSPAPSCRFCKPAQFTPMLRMSRSVTSTNCDSIITWAVALSSCSMMARMRPMREGRSVMMSALLR